MQFCSIHHRGGWPDTTFIGPDGKYQRISPEQCQRENEKLLADEDKQLAAQADQQRRATVAQTPAPKPQAPKSQFSEKIEADNGAVYAVDLSTARHFGSLVQAGVYDLNRGIIVAAPMWFQCAYAQVGNDPRLMSYVPPRSIGARLLAIACAEADRHPER